MTKKHDENKPKPLSQSEKDELNLVNSLLQQRKQMRMAAMQSEDGPVVAQLPSDKMVESMADLAELAEKKRIRDLKENDPVVQSLQKRGHPVTQENYLALAYPGEEMTPELMGGLPEFFEDLPVR